MSYPVWTFSIFLCCFERRYNLSLCSCEIDKRYDIKDCCEPLFSQNKWINRQNKDQLFKCVKTKRNLNLWRLSEGKRPLGRLRRRWMDNIRMDLQEVGCGYMDWIGLAQDRDRWRTVVSAVMNLRVPWNAGNFLTNCKPVSCSRRTLLHGVSKYIYESLHVSGNYGPMFRRNNCVFATLGTCYSVWWLSGMHEHTPLTEVVYCVTVAFTSLLPFKGGCRFGKSQKSQGAKSGL